jgi:16S rRNA (guanine527-N7)-methyltransferase
MTDARSEIAGILGRAANDIWRLGLSALQIDQLTYYAELLVEWNARLNLTRLTAPRDIAVKHFLDSLSLLSAVPIPPDARLIDIGTGAGFPGLVLKIARPDLRVTLVDSTAKKLTFCRAVADDLQLEHVVTLHARAEEAARQPEHARAYDMVTARAVAQLEKLLPWCAPFLNAGGRMVLMKGPGVEDEMKAARPVARKLGLALAKPIDVELPEADEPMERRLIVARRLDAAAHFDYNLR